MKEQPAEIAHALIDPVVPVLTNPFGALLDIATSALSLDRPSDSIWSDNRGSSIKKEVSSTRQYSTLELLEASYRNIPEYWDQDASSVRTPITVGQETNFNYPTVARYNRAEHFSRMDNDTLFFTFYFQVGTYQQSLAARELQNKGWVYHDKGQIWYRPNYSSEAPQKGSYVYFDYSGAWTIQLITREELQSLDDHQA